MAKIFYVGDWAVLTGPTFSETPFHHSPKGLDIFNYGKWLTAALESDGRHTVRSVPAWDFYKMGPGEYEAAIEEYDVLIFSDVDAKLFQLAPSFFDRQQFGKKVLTFPDRIRLTVEAVQAGKPAMFLGGWYSFNGELGKGGWGRTRLAEILPVRCLPYEDLVESTEGFTAALTDEGQAHFDGVAIDEMPPILGYNKTEAIDERDVWVRVRETGDPLVVSSRFGKGRVIAFTSDPAPHWGCNFVFWEQYADFWLKCIDHLTGRPSGGRAAKTLTPLGAASRTLRPPEAPL